MLTDTQRVALADYNRRLSNVKNTHAVEITEEELSRLREFAFQVATVRQDQPKYKGVPFSTNYNAFLLGICAELAVLKFVGYGIDCLELDITDNAYDFAHPDLKTIGCDIGVKVSKYGLPHLILTYDKHRVPEILCTAKRDDLEYEGEFITNIRKIYIDGIASVEMLENGITRDLIIKQDVEKWKDRSGFRDIDKLIPLNSLEDIWSNSEFALPS